jgi:hypothetical protein
VAQGNRKKTAWTLSARATGLGEFSPFGPFWQFFITEVVQIFVLPTFSLVKFIYINFDKIGLGYILVDFSLPHLVTLLSSHRSSVLSSVLCNNVENQVAQFQSLTKNEYAEINLPPLGSSSQGLGAHLSC